MTLVVYFGYFGCLVVLMLYLEGYNLNKEYYISLIDMIEGLKEEQLKDMQNKELSELEYAYHMLFLKKEEEQIEMWNNR